MMHYVALLRGINVGGKSQIAMSELRVMFETLGLRDVKTYINSGNVLFSTNQQGLQKLTDQIEQAITKKFAVQARVLIISQAKLENIVDAIPSNWVNDQATKCDVMFLWPEVDKLDILAQIPANPDLEDILYTSGAVIWRIDRDKASKSKVLRLAASPIYQHMTIRNPNTVRKILTIVRMQETD